MKVQFSTQVAAIAYSLLKGETLSIMNGFHKHNCTNLPREISRSIEQKFKVHIHREYVPHTSEYGHVGFYYRYKLQPLPENEKGMEVMREYVKSKKA